MTGIPHPQPTRFKPVSWREVEEGCAHIAEKILATNLNVDVIVGILRGGWIPARLLSDYLGVDTMGALEVKFYRGVGETAEKPVITQPLIVNVRDKVVLVVDDVSDTGKTLTVAVNFLMHYGPRKIVTATLYVKPWSMYRPDFYHSETDAWIIFPWDKAETVVELVAKRGLSIEEVSKITGESIDFIRRIFETRNKASTTSSRAGQD
ncbi:putative phosphoribosyltransferase [Hyperthermus butylicus DSM 5456]|uniref:Phosphoribosyltransferase n=1 Tax=Hyperthermus butylicus (strain DSM 5456 / JCM 9403 / PLM1-5) TaxID=415426 RepID=A2BK34_HYPBU|nr:phosphoribosyltransferase [Hyperthermus butylicus]ABM80345.1 putative phosphoribosyltransferase [Hyperthermus butylicus DSM 5456]